VVTATSGSRGRRGGFRRIWFWARFARRRHEDTGRCCGVPASAGSGTAGRVRRLARRRRAVRARHPEKTEVTVVGGGAVTPEFLTVLIGLTLYTASYIAEIVRGGIQAVPTGSMRPLPRWGSTGRRKFA